MKDFRIDSIDKMILLHLVKNARTPFLEIARNCEISGTAVHQRVQKLEKAGILKGSQYNIDPKALGYYTTAFIGVYLEKAGYYQDVVRYLEDIPEILECHYTTGNYAIFVKMICFDNEHLMQLLNHSIQRIEGVSSTETFISLEQRINRQAVPQ